MTLRLFTQMRQQRILAMSRPKWALHANGNRWRDYVSEDGLFVLSVTLDLHRGVGDNEAQLQLLIHGLDGVLTEIPAVNGNPHGDVLQPYNTKELAADMFFKTVDFRNDHLPPYCHVINSPSVRCTRGCAFDECKRYTDWWVKMGSSTGINVRPTGHPVDVDQLEDK